MNTYSYFPQLLKDVIPVLTNENSYVVQNIVDFIMKYSSHINLTFNESVFTINDLQDLADEYMKIQITYEDVGNKVANNLPVKLDTNTVPVVINFWDEPSADIPNINVPYQVGPYDPPSIVLEEVAEFTTTPTTISIYEGDEYEYVIGYTGPESTTLDVSYEGDWLVYDTSSNTLSGTSTDVGSYYVEITLSYVNTSNETISIRQYFNLLVNALPYPDFTKTITVSGMSQQLTMVSTHYTIMIMNINSQILLLHQYTYQILHMRYYRLMIMN